MALPFPQIQLSQIKFNPDPEDQDGSDSSTSPTLIPESDTDISDEGLGTVCACMRGEHLLGLCARLTRWPTHKATSPVALWATPQLTTQ